ncbi:MAG: CDP-alcohol phosphatidyltransferase family protein [Rhizomicrobium sp.]|jgi:phosphatidylglycerophosphate synthase
MRLSASLLTVMGFVAGLGAFATIATHHYWAGLGLIAANRLLAGLDGPVARRTEATDFGAFLETATGIIAMASIPFGFALAEPGRALAASFLIFSFIASGSTFLAFAATAAKRNMAQRGAMPIHHPGGLIESTEVFLALGLACVFPDWFSVIAYTLGTLCFATAGMRVAEGVARFGKP